MPPLVPGVREPVAAVVLAAQVAEVRVVVARAGDLEEEPLPAAQVGQEVQEPVELAMAELLPAALAQEVRVLAPELAVRERVGPAWVLELAEMAQVQAELEPARALEREVLAQEQELVVTEQVREPAVA